VLSLNERALADAREGVMDNEQHDVHVMYAGASLPIIFKLGAFGSSCFPEPSPSFEFATLFVYYAVTSSAPSLHGGPVYCVRTCKAFMLLKASSSPDASTFSALHGDLDVVESNIDKRSVLKPSTV
jgi:hypothetical protein